MEHRIVRAKVARYYVLTCYLRNREEFYRVTEDAALTVLRMRAYDDPLPFAEKICEGYRSEYPALKSRMFPSDRRRPAHEEVLSHVLAEAEAIAVENVREMKQDLLARCAFLHGVHIGVSRGAHDPSADIRASHIFALAVVTHIFHNSFSDDPLTERVAVSIAEGILWVAGSYSFDEIRELSRPPLSVLSS